jgi:hypothetical protein
MSGQMTHADRVELWIRVDEPKREDPLRALTEEERNRLKELARSQSEAASTVARAKMLLTVVAGKSYGAAGGGWLAERQHLHWVTHGD